MESYLKLFNKIWLDYCNILHIECYEFDKYMKIISKIRKNDPDFSNCKIEFIDLIEIMSIAIYKYKYENKNICYDEKCFDEDYDENNSYENDTELNCCYNIKTYLKKQYT